MISNSRSKLIEQIFSNLKKNKIKSLNKNFTYFNDKGYLANSDIVITTAQVFGRPAPKIITSEMVQAMQPGSVIVDMAVSSGGNVEGSQMGEIIDIKGVKIIGNSYLPGEVPTHSSQVYANNIYNLIDEFWDEETSSFKYDLNDEILANCLVTHKGNYINASVKERNE